MSHGLVYSYDDRVCEDVVYEPSRCVEEGQSYLLDVLVSDLGSLKHFSREINGFLAVMRIVNEGHTDGFDEDGQI